MGSRLQLSARGEITCERDRERHRSSRQGRCLDAVVSFLLLVRDPTSRPAVMARAKVVEFDYYQFIGLIRRATDAGRRIDKTDAQRWDEYVRHKGINEFAATVIARQSLENAIPVIIDEGLETDGLYFYSTSDEGCLRLQTIG
jgi:hypothetical protein